MGTPRAAAQAQRARALTYRLLFAFLALHFVWTVLSPAGGRGGAGGEQFEGRDDGYEDGGEHNPFGPPTAPGGGRRALDPHELCAWDTVVDSSTYDAAVDKMGWPTQYEQLVEEKRAINGVTCPLCGAQHLSVEWDSSDLREGGKCSVCGSFNRVRQLAAVILPHASRMTGRKLQSLKEVAATDLRIFSAQSCSGPLHDVLKKAPGYVCSEYISAEAPLGGTVRGYRHEDLQQTTFEAGSFDIIVSTEILALLPSPYQALFEMQRILKPGGLLVFTAPFSPSDYHDQVRASVENGKLVQHAPAIYALDQLHPRGVLLFTIFGRELADKLCMLGYNTTVHHLHSGLHGIIGRNAWVFAATKPRR